MEAELKTGKHFSIDEKVAILTAITETKDFYIKQGTTDAATRASCALLQGGIHKYLLRKYANKPCGYNIRLLENLRILSEQLFRKLKEHYHDPKFYISEGLMTYTDRLFWWDLHDSSSRIKAMDILKQAIIND